jgi:deoxyribose-phosphate aldolase
MGDFIENENIDMASFIDHTILKPDATEDQVRRVCTEAREYGFASVCVNPSYIPLVVESLKGSGVKACSVIGFPLGATTTRAKTAEAMEVIKNGAAEVDMVINVGALKSGNLEYVKNDIESVVTEAKGKALVKVIIETCLLTDDEKVSACIAAKRAGADFVKTSTGFSAGGATVDDIKLMKKTVGSCMGVKASGGIRDYETAVAMINAGASRIGASASVVIACKSKDTVNKGY